MGVIPVASEADPRRQLAGILLAAGGSSRFGIPKQTVLYRGEALVVRAARAALAVCPAGVTVVTGAAREEVTAALAGLPVTLCENVNWAAGLAGSMAHGVEHLPAAATAALMMLCDQPLVTAAELARLVLAWTAQPAVPAAAFYVGRAGVPAIFPRQCWAELRRLTGDRGAAQLLRRHGERLSLVDMPAAAADVDDPAALRALEAAAGQT